MPKTCTQCSATFEVTQNDLAFYEKISPTFNAKKYSLPLPTRCPDCRAQRRLSFRNERNLYHRKCDFTGRQIIAMYSSDKPFLVYDQEIWWGDDWDATHYAREFHFSKPFFDQFEQLFHDVPRINLINKEHENSEFCNFSIHNRNCYLLFTSGECEDSYYTNRSWRCKDCCDCSSLNEAELCYETLDSDHCYRCVRLQSCSNCRDCIVGYDLKGCSNCIACFGLRNANYCIANKQVSKEVYEKESQSLLRDLEALFASFQKHLQRLPRKYMDSINCESCTGNAVHHSRNIRQCYELMDGQDCTYVSNAAFIRDAMDINNDDNSELVYESVGSESNYMHAFNDICWFNKHLLYCSLCFHCEHCFGCSGLKHKKYCILNKQYSKEEYEALMPRIIEHMQRAGEWGEFFPSEISPFGYNETMAQYFFPQSKKEIKTRGWKWHDEENTEEQYMGPTYEGSLNISEVPDSITQHILKCVVTEKPYKITQQELQLYRIMNIPIPRKCPEQRFRDRLAKRNPRKLWDRHCAKCKKEIRTSFAPDRPEIVYCEECYLASVY